MNINPTFQLFWSTIFHKLNLHGINNIHTRLCCLLQCHSVCIILFDTLVKCVFVSIKGSSVTGMNYLYYLYSKRKMNYHPQEYPFAISRRSPCFPPRLLWAANYKSRLSHLLKSFSVSSKTPEVPETLLGTTYDAISMITRDSLASTSLSMARSAALMPRGIRTFAPSVLGPTWAVFLHDPEVTNRHSPHWQWKNFFKSFGMFSGHKRYSITKGSENDFTWSPILRGNNHSLCPSQVLAVSPGWTMEDRGVVIVIICFLLFLQKPQTMYFIKKFSPSCDGKGRGIQTHTAGPCGAFVPFHDITEHITQWQQR